MRGDSETARPGLRLSGSAQRGVEGLRDRARHRERTAHGERKRRHVSRRA